MANEAIHAQMVGKGGNQDSYPSACGSRFRPCPYCLLARLHDIFPPAAFKTQVIRNHFNRNHNHSLHSPIKAR